MLAVAFIAYFLFLPNCISLPLLLFPFPLSPMSPLRCRLPFFSMSISIFIFDLFLLFPSIPGLPALLCSALLCPPFSPSGLYYLGPIYHYQVSLVTFCFAFFHFTPFQLIELDQNRSRHRNTLNHLQFDAATSSQGTSVGYKEISYSCS